MASAPTLPQDPFQAFVITPPSPPISGAPCGRCPPSPGGGPGGQLLQHGPGGECLPATWPLPHLAENSQCGASVSPFWVLAQLNLRLGSNQGLTVTWYPGLESPNGCQFLSAHGVVVGGQAQNSEARARALRVWGLGSQGGSLQLSPDGRQDLQGGHGCGGPHSVSQHL